MDFSIIKTTEVDKVTFAWPSDREPSPLPPAAVGFGGVIYRVSNFGAGGDEYLFKEVAGPFEALELSASFYGDVTLPELASLAALAARLGVAPENLGAFRRRGIKGRRSFDALIKAASLPEEILSYMAVRDIPVKILALLVSFNEGTLNFIKSRLKTGKQPSVGEFIKFVNDAADFKELAENAEYSENFRFPERKSPVRRRLEDKIKALNEALAPVSAESPDFFESGLIRFVFTAGSGEDFAEACRRLADNGPAVLEFYKELENNDIR